MLGNLNHEGLCHKPPGCNRADGGLAVSDAIARGSIRRRGRATVRLGERYPCKRNGAATAPGNQALAQRTTDTSTNGHPCAYPHASAVGNAGTHVSPHGNANAEPNADADANTRTHTRTHTHACANTHACADANSDAHTSADTAADANSDVPTRLQSRVRDRHGEQRVQQHHR